LSNPAIQLRYRLLALVFLCLLLLAPATLAAQGCALCYTQAASSTQRFIHALRSGIIILMAPPTLFSLGITFVSYRRRNQFLEPEPIDCGANSNHSENAFEFGAHP
jgi:hypothetical protein